MNCALHDKSAKLGTDVEHIITFVLRYGAILKYSPSVYFAVQNFTNLQIPRANWFWSLFCKEIILFSHESASFIHKARIKLISENVG